MRITVFSTRSTLFRAAVRPGVGLALAAALCVGALSPQSASGEEPTALTAALAMEKLLVNSIEKAEKSVVAIGLFSRLGDRPELDAIPDKYGTGVVIGERLILTNHHVVLNEDAGDGRSKAILKVIRVAGHAQWLKVTVKAADPRSDLAVLEILESETAAPKLVPIKFAAAGTKVKKGQIVVALGNPYAIAADGQVSASWGIVSNVGRRVAKTEPRDATKLQNYGGLIQTDAKLNLGTSGGALINLRGEMVGLTTSLAATAGYDTPAGYAIAVDETFHRAVKALSEGREVEHGLIGLYPKEVPTQHGAAPRGVLVKGTMRGVPAEAHLSERDVITHVNGQRVRYPTELIWAIGQQPAAGLVSLRLERFNGDGPFLQRRVSIQLNKYDVKGTKIVTNPRPSWRGLHVDYARKAIGTYGRVLLSDCLLVTAVDPESPAADAGIEKGSLIQSAAGEDLAGLKGSSIAIPDDFLELVVSKQGPVELNVRPPDSRQLFADVVVNPVAAEAEKTDAGTER